MIFRVSLDVQVFFDEMRKVLGLAAELPEDKTRQGLEDMRKKFDKWAASLYERRPARGPAGDIRKAIDVILEHIENHGHNLWEHAISLQQGGFMSIRLVGRTNNLLENSFKHMKHGERRRSGRRILTQDLEHLPSEAMLAYNLKQDDYVNIVCGSLDRLPEAFAQLDQEKQAKRLMEIQPSDRNSLEKVNLFIEEIWGESYCENEALSFKNGIRRQFKWINAKLPNKYLNFKR